MAPKKHADQKVRKVAKDGPTAKRPKTGRKRSRHPSKDLVNYRQMQAIAMRERAEILAVLTERVASPKEISEERREGLSQVSYHVTVLAKAGLIVLDHEVPRRGAVEHFYRTATPTLIPPRAWDNLPPAMLKVVSTGVLQEFFDDVSASMAAEIFDDPTSELAWTPLILDRLGIEQIGQLGRDFLDSVMEVQTEASKRLSKEKGTKLAKGMSATVFLASFLSARSPSIGKKASAMRRR